MKSNDTSSKTGLVSLKEFDLVSFCSSKKPCKIACAECNVFDAVEECKRHYESEHQQLKCEISAMKEDMHKRIASYENDIKALRELVEKYIKFHRHCHWCEANDDNCDTNCSEYMDLQYEAQKLIGVTKFINTLKGADNEEVGK